MGRPTAVLHERELPEELAPAFVIDQQRSVPDRRGYARREILRRCLECKRENWILVSNVKRRLKQGLLVSGLCSSCNAVFRNVLGEGHPAWKGGRFVGSDGYVRVWERDRARKGGGYYQMEHRIVMAQMMGRPLRPHENVHHKNGVRDDNRPDNLELWARAQPTGVRVGDQHCPGCRCVAPEGGG